MKKVKRQGGSSKVVEVETEHGEMVEVTEEEAQEMRQRTTQAIAKAESRAHDLAAIASKSFEELAGSARSIVTSDIAEKKSLIGVPFVIYRIDRKMGDYNREFVTVHAITKDRTVIVFNDGSTGVCDQLKGQTASPDSPIFCPKGLRVSRYTYEDDDGNKSPAETYYLTGHSDVVKANGAPQPQV